METAFREAGWLRRELGKQGSLFGNWRGRWIWNSSWMNTLVGYWNSHQLVATAWDVPPCCRTWVERSGMHVPLRLLWQHIQTWSWGTPICHGIGRLPHVLEGDEGHLSQCIPFEKVPWVALLWRTAKEKDHSGYTLLPDRLGCIGRHIPPQLEIWTPWEPTGPTGILWSGSACGPSEGAGDCCSPPEWPWEVWQGTKGKITGSFLQPK